MSLSSLSRRHFFGGAASIAAAVTAPRTVFAQAPAAAPEPVPSGPFTIPPLTYPTNAFEPHIDARTMEIHHDKHHGAYVAALNSFAKDHPQIAEKPVLEVLGDLEAVPESIRTGVRNNLGGHANHTMFWEIMGPNGGKPEGEVLAAIDRDLGGLEKFQTDFNAAGVRQFGSGWVFVTVTKDGKLRSRPARTRTLHSWMESGCCLATMSGSTLIISATRTAALITSKPGGTR